MILQSGLRYEDRMMKPKILVIGSLNMDLVVETPVLPHMGETVLGSGFMTAPGGKGGNQAVAAARLGGDVSMAGCIGNDIFGRDLLTNLRKDGVNTDRIKILDSIPTGVAVIVVKDGDNSIIVNSGANFTLTPERIREIEPCIAAASILVMQFEIPLDAIAEAIRIAKKYQVPILLNPAPARQLADDLLGQVDILTPNESECSALTGLSVDNLENAGKAIAVLRAKGIPRVVVTWGHRGVVYNDGDQIIHKPVPEVNVIDTTAAGDSFSGALAVALAEGKTIHEAVDFANLAGTLTVTRKGAQTSLPTLEDLKRFRQIIYTR